MRDLTGIGAFSSTLQRLDLRGCVAIDSLAPVAELTQLRELRVDGIGSVDLRPSPA